MSTEAPEALALFEQRVSIEDRDETVRALLGAVILGVLDHVGKKDLARWKKDSTDDVTVANLIIALSRKDTGLHGCGFEHAVHGALTRDSRIPDSARTTVTSEVGAVFELLRVPVSGWSQPLQSVKVAVSGEPSIPTSMIRWARSSVTAP